MTRAEILAAVKAEKSLAYADLRDADLSGADVGEHGFRRPGRRMWCLTVEEQEWVKAHRKSE